MNKNYMHLEQSLGSIVDRLTPETAKADPAGLYRHFEKRRDVAYERFNALHEGNDSAMHRATLIGVGGGFAAVGILALPTGPVAIPAAAALGAVSMGYFLARTAVNQLKSLAAEKALQRERELADDAPRDVLASEYAKEQRGGMMSRLYLRTADLVRGFEGRTVDIIQRIDEIGLSGAEHRAAVKKILIDSVTPQYADYLRRRALDKYDPAAHLMARLHSIPELNDVSPLHASLATSLKQGTTLPKLGGLTAPLTHLFGGRAASGSLQVEARTRSAAAEAGPQSHYGWIAAGEGESRFLQSLGIEAGPYNETEGRFPVKLDDAALRQLDSFSSGFAMKLATLPDGMVDPETRRLGVGLQQVDVKTLDGYRAYLRFTMEKEGSDLGAVSALAEVNREMHRRTVAAQSAPSRESTHAHLSPEY